MARPKCARFVNNLPNTRFFKPRGIPLVELEEVILAFDEYEALRLADLDGLYQEDAAVWMNISRATFGRIVESARRKVADALINGKALRIEGGIVKMTNDRKFKCSACEHKWQVPHGGGRPMACPQCQSTNFHRAESDRGYARSGGNGGGRRGGRHGRRSAE
jgi:uncharacterized protein